MKPKQFRPMLAGTLERKDIDKIQYPVWVQPKLDGIRCIVMPDGRVLSRSLKPIPNRYITGILSKLKTDHPVDGELMLKGEATFQDISSAVMTEDNEPDFEYHIFDCINGQEQFLSRMNNIQKVILDNKNLPVVAVGVHNADTAEEVISLQEKLLKKGFEGIMLRSPFGGYKYGRATLREQYLLKFKNFSDSEAVVIGVDQRLHNDNPAETDELGYTERSSHKENMKPVEELGALHVIDIKSNVQFRIGSGFTQAQRKELWKSQDSLIGKIVKYKYFEIGVLEAPRFPVFLGFRDTKDMTDE